MRRSAERLRFTSDAVCFASLRSADLSKGRGRSCLIRHDGSLWRCPVPERLMRDVRYAGRALRADVGFTLAAVVTLAFGIGAVTALFTVLDGVLLKPLAFADAERTVALENR